MSETPSAITRPGEKTHSPSREPRRLLTIIHAGHHGAAGLEHVIDDLIDALRAYERVSAAHAPNQAAYSPMDIERLHVGCDERLENTGRDGSAGDVERAGRDEPTGHSGHAGGGGPRQTPNNRSPRTVLVVLAEEDLRDDLLCGIFRAVRPQGGERLYAVIGTDRPDASFATQVLARLANACAEHDVAYSGGAILCGALLFERHARTPRMGRMRRGRSEQIDRLIGAMRIGCPVSLLPDTAGDNTLIARCPLPRLAYRATTSHRKS